MRPMDVALRAALVTAALNALGGTLDDAFAAVDDVVAEVGEPTDDASLHRVLDALGARAAARL